MAGYSTRQSTISDGGVGYSSLWNDEYNQILAAFAASTGHAHDGTAGEGGYVPVVADSDKKNYIEASSGTNTLDFYVEVAAAAVEQFSVADGAILPTTDNDIDLGSTTYQFKDIFAKGSVTFSGGGALTGTWTDLGSVTTVDINGGTLDGVVIGGASAAAGTFTALNSTGITDTSDATTIIMDANENVSLGGVAITSGLGANGCWVQVGDGAYLNGALAGGGSGWFDIAQNNYFDGTNYRYTNTGPASTIELDVGGFEFLTAVSGTAGNIISFTSAITGTAAGLVTIPNFASSSAAITGGSVSGITDLAIADGGTGASTAAGARTNLGLGTIATLAAPSGTVVGTTDTQTLTNKTLTSPVFSGTATAFTSTGIDDNATATALTINSSDNLGIGITSLGAWHADYSAIQLGGIGSIFSTTTPAVGNIFSLGQNYYFDGTNYKYLITNEATDYYQFNGTHVMRVAGSGTAGTNISWTQALSVDSTGTVTINDVDINGGSITGITDLAIADGGTGASTAAAARTNLAVAEGGTFVDNADGNPNISSNTFSVDSSVTVSTWEEVGPTGAANVWVALNSIPTDVDWIEVTTRISIHDIGQTASSIREVLVFARDDGSSASNGTQNLIAAGKFYTDSSGNGASESITTRRIQVSVAKFEVLWTSTVTSSVAINMTLTGYGYNV